MPSGTSPQAHVRDGVGLACVGVAGWGLAPLLGEPGLAVPALAAGAISGGAVLTTGHRRARRSALMVRMSAAVLPMLGNSGAIRAGRWTHGWPGVPRQVKVRYGTGRIKIADGSTGSVVDIGEKRWVSEVVRAVGARLDAHYKVKSNDSQIGRLTLQLYVPTAEEEVESETVQTQRAKRIVTELLGASTQITKITAGEDGEVTRMEVTHEAGSKLVALGYRRRVERTVNGMLPGRWRAHWDMEADTVVFEVRPSLPDSLWLPPLEQPDDDPLENYRAVEIPYAVDEDGEVISWRPAVIPQWLITGTTGSGKTSTGHGIITQISQYGWPVWIADGKGVEFLGFRDWPNVQIVASTIPQQVAVIHRAWELMEYRYQLVVDGLASKEDFEPMILFVDEFTDLKSNLLDWYSGVKVKGDPTKPRVLAEIGSIARKGRTARVHMVLAMQRPDAEILSGENRENFGMRTSMGPLSPQGAEMMWNNQVTGVALPRGRVGRAIGTNKSGFPVEMQAYRVPDPKDSVPGTEEYELLQKLRPTESRYPRMVIVPPEIDWAGDDPVEPTYTDFVNAEWVTAEARPDLDPLANQEVSADQGRALSSPMALFDLDGPTGAKFRSAPVDLVEVDDEPEGGMSPAELGATDFAGYSQLTTCRASQLRVGDLICVGDDYEAWVVVEEEPIPDFDDEESLVVSWRDDQDESGQQILEAGAMVQVRRPLEDD